MLLLPPPPQAASVLVKQKSMAVAKGEREKEKLVSCADTSAVQSVILCQEVDKQC
ncbi:MAG: hypothetical protein IE928_09860 [Gammaproteobacteria bacterium]|nr:hypothetical protein [Gammaproteobacteria bacterium]